MKYLTNKKWIILKGLIFLFFSVIAFLVLLLHQFDPLTLFFLILLVWSSCRFYYFLFYVLENFVDSDFKYSGLFSLLCHLTQKCQHPKNK